MKLYLFPGLAADHRLFEYQRKEFSNIVVPDWLSPKTDENLSQYCQRWVESLPCSSEDMVGGMSFGGQVALEIARLRPFKAVILLSANRRGEEISASFKMQNRLLQTLPEPFVRSGLKNIAIPKLKTDEKLNEEQVNLLNEMVDAMDFQFFRWSTMAAATWDYRFDPSEFSMPIYQLHGEKDPIISLSNPKEVDLLKGAGHLINFTHADSVNKWIAEKMAL